LQRWSDLLSLESRSFVRFAAAMADNVKPPITSSMLIKEG